MHEAIDWIDHIDKHLVIQLHHQLMGPPVATMTKKTRLNGFRFPSPPVSLLCLPSVVFHQRLNRAKGPARSWMEYHAWEAQQARWCTRKAKNSRLDIFVMVAQGGAIT